MTQKKECNRILSDFGWVNRLIGKIYHQTRKIVYQKQNQINAQQPSFRLFDNLHHIAHIYFLIQLKQYLLHMHASIVIIMMIMHLLLLYISNRSMDIIYSIDNKLFHYISIDYIIIENIEKNVTSVIDLTRGN